ncbi:MAG: hypothetical protein HRT54_03710 [Colwellia sp.]|nr:hypothetical protein [Colwellia sp.]
MSNNSIKSIRNGVIASVVAGVILLLIPQVRELSITAAKSIWSFCIWCWDSMFQDYSFSGWFFLLLFILAFIGSVVILINIADMFKQPEHKDYVSDNIFDVNWRWDWRGVNISNLWCYCPTCDATLVYDDSTCHSSFYDRSETKFICENCNRQTMGAVAGGDKSYALGAVKREIDRRIRVG